MAATASPDHTPHVPVLPTPCFITTDHELRALVPELAQQPFLAIDTEANSLHAYQEQVCLIQLSTRTSDYLIDPLSIVDMDPLGDLLADPRLEKILHAAEYDLIGLRRDFGFFLRNVFDTMIAARVAGHSQVGLGNLLERYLRVQTDKRHQRDDWGRRPLSPASLRYAQMDTHFLGMIRNDLYDELQALGRLEEARDAFAELDQLPAQAPRFDPDGFWRIGRPEALNGRQMAILRAVYLWREELAGQMDRPAFKVLGKDAMLELARRAPETREELGRIRGMPRSLLRRHGESLLQQIAAGKRAQTPAAPPRPARLEPVVRARMLALREWRRQQALRRNLSSDVVFSKSVMMTLAQRAPRTMAELETVPGMGPWRLENYGPQLLELLHGNCSDNGTGQAV
ncbi:MAG: HRDC domain-containing protein [Anaerolineaceae bacterium]|nr:HRDC domain-containing protein [Anaerolineaceae bacterium]